MRKGGRPTKYTEVLGRDICARIAQGDSLRKICEDEAYPTARTVHNWLVDPEKEEFFQQYARAREAQAHAYFDQIVDIADGSPEDLDAVKVQRDRLRIDARKWACSKLAPKSYGDKIEVGGPDGGALKVEIVRYTDPPAK